MKIIGITGPTGAGKTTALEALAGLGAEVIDCDQVYHQLLQESGELRKALTERFGEDILDGAGELDRKKLGAIVFADAAALQDLNSLTHRFIIRELNFRIAAAQKAGRRAVAIDAIALIESGLRERCQAVVGVVAPEEVRIKRIMEREGITEEYARSRVAAQKGEDFFRRECPVILENGGEDREAFFQKATKIFQNLLEGN